ncbi:MAG TPA: sulfur carrier protein ThiS [Candidatus Omnitrophota bacterium]|nr:sulfur carrier protein ThiS [Candidatus Omnitrophota bacterium]
MLSIWVNGEKKEVNEKMSLSDLLKSLGVDSSSVAVERNREIVLRDLYPSVRLGEGDRIEVVHFVGGG